MKLFVAAFGAETNSFAPFKTTLDHFAEICLIRPDEDDPAAIANNGHAEFLDRAAADGHEVVRGTLAYAMPSGPLTDDCYFTLRDEILEQLRAAMPLDIVLLNLHGAMMSESLRDCEGYFLEEVRKVVGPKVKVGALLDLHAHLSDRMMRHADILISFKEYPHTDFAERGRRLYELTFAAARGEIDPVMVSCECRTLGAFETTSEPMMGFVSFMRGLEDRPKVLDAALVHSFPWGDCEDGGAKVLAITDGDEGVARDLCAEVKMAFLAIREEAIMRPFGIDDAVREILASPDARPFVIGDASDNPGGGAAGDSIYLLAGLLEAGLGPVAAGVFWDESLVTTAWEAGEGAHLSTELGGKASALSGPSLHLEATVRCLKDDANQAFGEGDDITRLPLGRCAVLDTGNAAIVVSERRFQTLSPDCFTAFGIDPAGYRVALVKSSNHFRAAFAPVAAKILAVTGPGVMTLDLKSLPFKYLPRPMWPLDQ